MRNRTALSVASVMAVALLAIAHASLSQPDAGVEDPGLERFAGTYRARDADGGASVIARAVTEATEPMGGLRRNIARRRILESETALEVLKISAHEDGWIVDLGHGRRNVVPTSGTFVTAPTATGGTVKVKLDLVNGRLRLTYRDPDGGAVQHFALSSDGSRLSFDSTITSPHLPGPISYRIELERVH